MFIHLDKEFSGETVHWARPGDITAVLQLLFPTITMPLVIPHVLTRSYYAVGADFYTSHTPGSSVPW